MNPTNTTIRSTKPQDIDPSQFLDASQVTNWPQVKDFVPTAHADTYPFISTASANLLNKSVFITGASRGIGKAIAISFAKAGCSRLAIGARSSLRTVEEEILVAASAAGRPKPQVLCIEADLSTEAGTEVARNLIESEFGGSLDVLVNNAGRAEAIRTLGESNVEDYWSTWEVNIKGVYLCTRSLLPLLLKSDTRTVLNVGSAGGHMLVGGRSGYQTTKFALCRLSEFMAQEYGDQGLISIVIHPGDVLTDMTSRTPKEFHRIFVKKPELAADTMVWLAKERRQWLSGRFVSSTWDMQELEGRMTDIINGDLLKFRLSI